MPEVTLPTQEEFITELNRYNNTDIAAIFKVNEAAVINWKAGNDLGWPAQWEVMIRVLNERGTPVA